MNRTLTISSSNTEAKDLTESPYFALFARIILRILLPLPANTLSAKFACPNTSSSSTSALSVAAKLETRSRPITFCSTISFWTTSKSLNLKTSKNMRRGWSSTKSTNARGRKIHVI